MRENLKRAIGEVRALDSRLRSIRIASIQCDIFLWLVHGRMVPGVAFFVR